MDLNAISSWNSVGTDLNAIVHLGKEVERLKRETKELKVRNRFLEEQNKGSDASGDDDEPEERLDVINQKRVWFLLRAARRFVKGFGVGFGLRFVFGALPIAFKIAGGKLGFQEFVTHIKDLVIGDPLRYGLFIGTFVAMFESLMRATKPKTGLLFSKDNVSRGQRTIFSGLVAALSILWLPEADRFTFSIFVAIRGAEVLANYVVDAGLIPSLPHHDTCLSAAASGVVIWAWLHNTVNLDLSYRRFLDVHGGQQQATQILWDHWHSRKSVAVLAADAATAAQNALRKAQGVPPIDWNNVKSICEVLHPKHSHISYFFHFFKGAYLRALPVYLPVYIAQTVLFRLKHLIRHPVEGLSVFASNVARSSLFLALYCSMCWTAACAGSQIVPKSQGITVLAGMAGGSCVLIERKSRRIELALFVLSHAVKVMGRTGVMWGVLPTVPQGMLSTTLFCLGMAIIMHSYVERPGMMRKTYLGLFEFFFGSGKRSAGFGDHKNNADDIVM